MNNRKRRKEIRKTVGLPDDNGQIWGVVGEDPAELCENTMTSKCEPGMPLGANQTKHTMNSASRVLLNKGKTNTEYGSRPVPREANRKATIEWGLSSSVCQDGTPFDFGASGGATSPNTEVNADHQGVIDETLGPSQYKK